MLSSPTSGKRTSGGLPSPSGRAARLASGSGLPPPPSMATTSGGSKSYAQTISQSMTIDEMRELHHRALQDAEAKRTELRLVLASRYRELVGSSDEVLKMRERSQELHELVHALPGLLTTLVHENDSMTQQIQSIAVKQKQEESKEAPAAAPALSEQEALSQLRRQVSTLPRIVHRALDQQNLHGAALNLIHFFTLVANQTDAYPLAAALAKSTTVTTVTPKFQDAALAAQMKMTFLHVQTIPDKIARLAQQMLQGAASYGPLLAVSSNNNRKSQPPIFGAQWSAAALSALDLLDRTAAGPAQRASKLLDLYYDSKAKLLQSLLDQLNTSTTDTSTDADSAAPDNAEEILSKILLILQYDIILHPYQIFVLRNFPVSDKAPATASAIVASLPFFDIAMAKSKCSHFLAQHLPLLRTKVKSILVSIAGTTASALGKMRQSLYDKTDGADCMALLKDVETNLCSWDDALVSLVDIPTVAAGGGMPLVPPAGEGPKFSLWSALFSNTFSSLVHNILTTSFQSVHTKVVSTLRTSLANAPPLEAMLPHEAYRNTLKIATDLDKALWNVRKDAHELLVHAEEREESERRLRLSLYVQTCEIMGRLVCELRRMVLLTSSSSMEKTSADAVQELIVGRLCYLLKFRLTSLPTLLDPQSAPSSATAGGAANSTGMINRFELQSAFELADDNDDGLITFTEAMEAVESAFSGTPFHGAEMVKETLLLGAEYDIQQQQIPQSSSDLAAASSYDSSNASVPLSSSMDAPANVTISELALLTARGLRHDNAGTNSALGTVQQALDDIVENCFLGWAKASLRPSVEKLSARITNFYEVASTTTDDEWNRLYNTGASPGSNGAIEKVSPMVVGYILDVSSVLNGTIFPTDSLLPVPSMEYATSLGIVVDASDPEGGKIPTMKDTIRWSLVRQSLALVVAAYQDAQKEHDFRQSETDDNNKKKYKNPPVSSLLQLKADLSFVKTCYFERLERDLAAIFEQRQAREDILGNSKNSLEELLGDTDRKLTPFPRAGAVAKTIPEKHQRALEAIDLFLTSLLGRASDAASSSTDVPSADLGTTASNATPWINNPLPSSRRFALLPVQSDRGLTEMQLRKYGKKNAQENESDEQGFSTGMGGLQKGLGFLFGRS
ncbi:expressed unknown protein [Seminavis robusta]|uniref:Conserved oligomeric Golgi complex subunit 1 n=1 Tax=Seminavis robusta TaxID=568900 RepID=A0A9N8DIX2_9STRA|nr:expressed unknown protein [Seminavis robusta]|eukprot:Sro152_g069550.1 n/a (1134) ;mRNA; r:72739-76140